MSVILLVAIAFIVGALVVLMIFSGVQENKPNKANEYLAELTKNETGGQGMPTAALPQSTRPGGNPYPAMMLFALVMIVIGVVLLSKNPQTFDLSVNDTSGEEVEIRKGDYVYVFSKGENVDMDLRIFGYNSSRQMFGSQNVGKYGVLSHLFIAMPLKMNRAMFEKSLCELRSANSASMLQVIAETAEVNKGINRLANSSKGLCAHVAGYDLRLKHYQFKDKDPQSAWEFSPGGQFNFNPRRFLLLSDIAPVECR